MDFLLACRAGVFYEHSLKNRIRAPFWKQLKTDWGREEGRGREKEETPAGKAYEITERPLISCA